MGRCTKERSPIVINKDQRQSRIDQRARYRSTGEEELSPAREIMVNCRRSFVLCLAMLVIWSVNANEEGATETQTAQCTISSGDVKASAQASVTTRLDGVCETKSMMTAFHILESRLLLEIYNIRLVLSQILHPNFDHQQHNQFMFPQVNLNPTLYHNISPPPHPPTTTTTAKPDVIIPQTISANRTNPGTINDPIVFEYPSTTPQLINHSATTEAPFQYPAPPPVVKLSPRNNLFPFLKSLPAAMVQRKTSPRDFEIYKFNNTILSGNGNEVQVFTYFWKIENYTEKLKAADERRDLFSPAFVISGLNLRIRASLNHLSRDYLYLGLEEMPKNETSASSVILETGDLFHEIEPSSTMFRYKIIVLDQSPKKSDLISQEFSDTTSGFMIPSSALTSTDNYVKDNLILIKVILYL